MEGPCLFRLVCCPVVDFFLFIYFFSKIPFSLISFHINFVFHPILVYLCVFFLFFFCIVTYCCTCGSWFIASYLFRFFSSSSSSFFFHFFFFFLISFFPFRTVYNFLSDKRIWNNVWSTSSVVTSSIQSKSTCAGYIFGFEQFCKSR